jgi:hypothetical protein
MQCQLASDIRLCSSDQIGSQNMSSSVELSLAYTSGGLEEGDPSVQMGTANCSQIQHMVHTPPLLFPILFLVHCIGISLAPRNLYILFLKREETSSRTVQTFHFITDFA